MCNKDKAASLRLLVILTICSGCLLAHFVAEDLAPIVHVSGLGLAGQGGWSHLICENCDEHFVFPSPTGMPAEHPIIQPEKLVVMDVPSFANSPLLPPPNS
jgi:hypothetical protein